MRARRCEQRCHRRARSCNRENQVSGPSILASRLSRVPGTAVLPPFAPVRSHHAPTTSGGARNRCNCEKTPRQLIPAPFGAHPSARLLPAPPPLPSALPYARGIHFTSVRPLTFPPRPGGPRTVATVRKPRLLIPVPFWSHPSARQLPAPPPPHPPTPTALIPGPSTPCVVFHALRPFLPPRSRPIDHDRLVRLGRKFRCTVRSPSYLHELLEYLTNS